MVRLVAQQCAYCHREMVKRVSFMLYDMLFTPNFSKVGKKKKKSESEQCYGPFCPTEEQALPLKSWDGSFQS